MYIGFIPWYQGLKMVGSARGSQVQQLQVFMTLGWSAILLGETISLTTLICTLGIVFAVAWAIFSRSKVKTIK
jgi:drug/metabolite transporter (DMT)-like permease